MNFLDIFFSSAVNSSFFLIFLVFIFFGFLFFLYIKFEKLREKNRFLTQERNDLLDTLDRISESQERELILKKNQEEEREKNRERILFEKIEKLENSREKLEHEQYRVIQKEKEKKEEQEKNNARLWNEHENMVLSEIQKICQMRECNFLFFENSALPEEFSGSLKPDAMISFLDQYIIFDAKKSKNPKVYIDSQVKISAQKYKNSETAELIYSTVFFVLPEEELEILEKKYFYEEGYTFIIISPSSLLSTLMMLKKITEYENILDFDPVEREGIVHLLAQYDRHISYQNASNAILSHKYLDVMHFQKKLPVDLQEAIVTKKNAMKNIHISSSEIAKYSNNSMLEKRLHSSS